MVDKVEYEVLCVDNIGNCVVKTEKAFCYALLSHSDLFVSAKLSHDDQIEDKKNNLEIKVAKIDPDDDIKEDLRNSFMVRVKAPYKNIEPFRLRLLTHLKELKFEHLYVLNDDASSEIAKDIYPAINSVENALRRYLIKFLVTKLGPNWWSLTADAEMKKKVVSRKNNESNFSKKADSKAYLIDFGELGKIVYAQSSGFISRDDIYTRVMEMEETSEAVSALKVELQSNYNKFFKESFKDKNFQQKWEELEKIRHKVAHNSLFIEGDRINAIRLTGELISIIEDADEKIAAISFSSDDREAIQGYIASESSLKVITREEMITKLKTSMKFTRDKDYDFLGLKSFVVNYLGNAGFDFKSSYDVIDQLEQDGVIELYEHQGDGHERAVKAIKINPPNLIPNRPLEGLKEMLQAQES